MLRFILKSKVKNVSGAEYECIHTYEYKMPDLQAKLCAGGFGEDTYDITELLGVEIIDEADDKVFGGDRE